jgi:urease accessory protein
MTSENELKKLLFLLQVANSSFPTGAFNHSYGFETLIDRGVISNAETLDIACRDWLLYGVAPVDGAAVVAAHRAALAGDLDQLVELDNLVGALKLPREIREASYKTGYAFLTAVAKVFEPTGMVATYAQAVKEGKCEGHQAVAFGVAGTAFGVPEVETALVFLQSALTNLVGVAARLIPLGQLEVQRIVAKAWPLLIQAVKVAKSRKPEEFGTTTVAHDIAAMHHERLYSRLCMS